MSRILEKRGLGTAEIFSYNSSGAVPLPELAGQFADFLGDSPVRIVAHSMGGVITRLAAHRHPRVSIRAAAFLCVPHHGSVLASMMPLAGVRQLAPGSPVLHELASQTWEVPTLAIWCPGDLLVVPGSSARWEKASREICCPVPLHNWPVFSRYYHNQIADFFLSNGQASAQNNPPHS